MKKIILLFSLCFFFSNSYAQMTARVEGGINLATIDLSDTSIFQNGNVENRTGFYLAFIPKIYLNEKISLNIEAQYSEEGYKLDNDQFEAKFQYVRILPQLEIKLMNAFGIYGGYSLGFNISEQVKLANGSFETPVVDTIKKTDQGFTVGARVYLGKLSLTGKYNFGFQNITDLIYTDASGQTFDVEQRNRNFQIGVGYQLF